MATQRMEATRSLSLDKENYTSDAASAADSGAAMDDKLPSFGQVMELQGDAQFHEVTLAAPLDPRSATSIKLYLIFLVCALNATCSGFDGSIFSSINAMSQYKSYFHKTETGSSTGIIFAIYTIGSVVGSFFTGPLCDHYGRRAGIFTGSAIIMLGAIIVTAAQAESWLLGGRFVLGFGISISTSAAPTLALELAPPQWRARVVGYYNTFFYTGSILATGVTYASNKMPGEIAWRLPLGLQLIPPFFICLGVLFIPESPRWNIARGRKEKAVSFLTKYHGGGDINHPLVQLELREFEEQIKVTKATAWWDYRELFASHNARWRILMVTFISFFAQMSGNSVLTYFLPTMYTNLGIKSTDRRLLLTFANSIVSCFGAVCGSATNDRIGRRTKLWIGSAVLASLLAAVTGFSSQFASAAQAATSSAALSNGGVAMIFLFGCAYSFVYTPMTALYPAECLDNSTRAKGMGIHVVMNGICGFYNTYVTSIALKRTGWHYYFVFVGLNVVYGFVWFFFGVETRGRTLEELNEVFDAPFPPRAALQKAKLVKRENTVKAVSNA